MKTTETEMLDLMGKSLNAQVQTLAVLKVIARQLGQDAGISESEVSEQIAKEIKETAKGYVRS